MAFQHFKVLTFDVIGTLIDFEKGVLDGVRAVGGGAAKSLSDDDIFRPYVLGRDLFPGRSSRAMTEVYRHMARELGLDTSNAAAEAFQLKVLQWPAFPDSIEALRRLRARFRLVAMTNGDRVAFSCYSHTLGHPFHDSVTADETGVAKPNPAFFAYNLGRQSVHGYKQEEILHVAQSQHHDIGIAKQLGYTVCWIERRQGKPGFGGTPTPKQITKPDFHFTTIKQLADAVDAEG